jgi:hypothetical protein
MMAALSGDRRSRSTKHGSRWWAALVLLFAALNSACGTNAIQSVHALHTFEREQVTPALVKQHLDDLSTTLALVKRVLRETKYQPGDAWTQGLALTSTTAGQATQLIMSEHPGDALPTTLAIYARHVTDVLSRAATEGGAAATDVAGAASRYASILDALAQVDPKLAELRQDFETERKLAQEVRDATVAATDAANRGYQVAVQAARRKQRSTQDLSAHQAAMEQRGQLASVANPQAKQVIKDALATTSVTFRLASEAAALASLLLLEIPRLATVPPREYPGQADVALALIQKGPAQVEQIRADLEIDLQSLKQLVAALARLDATDFDAIPGFAYREGLVDEVVGFTTDMLHFKADAGTEAYFFNSFPLEGSRDYTGRVNTLRYHVDPILLASARFSASFDVSHLPGAGGLNLGYATNRVYSSGGTIETGSLASELGVTGRWSDAIDAALLISGWQASVRLANFTSGTVDQVLAANGAVNSTASFGFTLKEIDFSREIVGTGKQYAKSVVIRVGYFDYTLPRIMYQFRDATPNADKPTWVYLSESPAQPVRTQLFTWGALASFEVPTAPGLDTLVGFNLSWGFGRQQFYFVQADRSHDDHAPFTVALSGIAQLGMRWRFVGLSRFRASIEALYQLQYLNSSLGTTLGLDREIPTGTQALFHGPHAALSASF